MRRFRPTARVRRSRVFRTLATLCRKYLRWYGNASLRADRNGERALLERLRTGEPWTIVDVGANVGRWAAMAAAAFPAARIFALEIVPATYERLRANTASNPRIHAVNTGLADRPGWLRIRFNPAASTHATYTAYPHPWDREEALDCAVVTGDEFLRAQGIDAVDFLKIDVEGAEPLVLQGFGAALSQRRIRFVQFEYGRFNILTGFLLKDFYDLFRAHGYLVGKIYPDYVELREYDLGDEDFVGGNYLACPVEDPLRARLAGPRR